MNKRTQSIASLFASRPPETGELSADNPTRAARVPSGSVRSMKDSFSQVERENEALRQSLTDGARILEIDPALVDPSPFADRFPDDEDTSSIDALTSSIRENGQEVPVLLRRHPADPSRYQTAFGHRRVRAARILARPVRAVVREMDDDALAVAQGLENAARQDLTFIERAVFAARLEDQGQGRAVIQRALAIDKAEASKLLAIARSIPPDILSWIGRAPKIGRGRWQALAELAGTADALERIRRHLAATGATPAGSDERFTAALRAGAPAAATASERSILALHSGRRIAALMARGRDARLVIDRSLGADFADFLADRLPALYEDYAATRGEPNPPPRADGTTETERKDG
ncbi:plasmid partitioning protein RepB [Aureimonas jatrophae]|uniref:Chromosome partitioning protein, ParB family n=1 Tax=Aureimonas jatrophae TaxID=1166073 RepID=A0A1H0MY50_9HYPH|nr:plasmid partitioning protein RepB [Aureimonas jatrophae]MBB3952997.1 ParB family chromosome partitioning protein [Aureimonas jatrophae]SDO85215.1 chromosome partitioning protein, ParB family [Aureimonas jatrophae]